MMLHGFDDDDGVVDNNTDCQYEAKQREGVDAEAKYRKSDKGAQQRHGNGEHRDDGRAEALEKKVDHEQHEDDRFNERVLYLMHRRLNRRREVERSLVLHVRGELVCALLEDALDLVGCL